MKFATICSGSSGNCTYIEGGHTSILVDAGCSNRHLSASLAKYGKRPQDISALLISHEHSDHISGITRFARRFGIPVYASVRTWENLPCRDDFFPEDRHIFEYGMSIGDIDIDFFRLSHDAVQPVGFVFACSDTRVAIATDTGVVTPSMARAVRNADGLVLEANHDVSMLMNGKYSYALKQRVHGELGHLSNQQAGLALRELAGENTRSVILAHLSEQNNLPRLALSQVRALVGDSKIHITVAPRCNAHPLIEL